MINEITKIKCQFIWCLKTRFTYKMMMAKTSLWQLDLNCNKQILTKQLTDTTPGHFRFLPRVKSYNRKTMSSRVVRGWPCFSRWFCLTGLLFVSMCEEELLKGLYAQPRWKQTVPAPYPGERPGAEGQTAAGVRARPEVT